MSVLLLLTGTGSPPPVPPDTPNTIPINYYAGISIPTVIEIYLCDPMGIRIECLDYVTEFEYGKLANNIAPFRIRLPSKFDRKKIRLDNIIEIWYGFGPGTLKLDYCGFVRAWIFADNAGNEYTELFGYSTMELLKRRIVANYAGSAQSKVSTYADDAMKAIVKDQLGADTTAARDLTSVGGGFTIQKDLSKGASIVKEFAYENVLEICQSLADASATVSTEIYFDIVPIISSSTTGMIAFQFQTFSNQLGNDRTWDSSQPIFVGPEWGNFQNGSLEYDYNDEANYCYVLGPGEGASQYTLEKYSSTRIGKSIWNRREGEKNASSVTDPLDGLDGEGYLFLQENKPRFRFGGDIIETPAFRYKKDWDFGDRVTAIYAGIQKDAMIGKLLVSCDSSGQKTIKARLEVEE